jgi:hypothetical protein
MHCYQPLWPEDRADWTPPSPTLFRYRDACDVAAYAALDALTTWYTYPHIWHLDDDGQWQCCSKGSSLDSVQRFAENPEWMLECRLTPVDPPCPDNWVILEPRQRRLGPERYDVNEDDARAFLDLRSGLAGFGITLLDVVVFNQEFQWWSLHELTSGTTAWPATSAAVRRRPRARKPID